MHLTSHITHSNGYAPYIAYYRSNGYDQRFRKLKPKPKLNPPNAHRSQIKICENRQTQNVQFRLMPNAFRILKPIQKSSKRVWVFRNTGANAFAKNQMRLAYEDKRDLYCKSVKDIWSYRANEVLHCYLEMYVKGRSRSLIFELIQGYGGMHHWVKCCVNRWRKSQVIVLTIFCIAT